MNRFTKLALVLGALSFAWVGASGIDLVTSRTGGGLLGLGVAVLFLSVFRLIRPGLGGRPWVALLCLLGGGYFVGWAWVSGPVGLAVPDVVLVLVLLGVYLAVTASSQRMRAVWVALLAALAAVNVGIAFAQEASGRTLYIWQEGAEAGEFIGGLFGHYNAFASFLNGSVFILLSYLVLGRNKALQVGCGILSVGLVVALLYSGSRGGWLSFVVGGAVWLTLLVIYLVRQKSRLVGMALIAWVVLGVGGVTSSYAVIQKISNKRAAEASEDVEIWDGGRLAFQQMAFETFLDSPVVGQGPRAFSYRALEKWDKDTLPLWMGNPKFAHNEYLQVLADYGLVGFLILLVVIFIHGILGVTSFLEKESKDRNLPIWQLGAVGGLAAMLCQAYFSFIFHFPACVGLLALHLGILGSKSEADGSSFNQRKIPGLMVGIAGLGLAAGLMFLGLNLTRSYLQTQDAGREIIAARSGEELMKGLDALSKAGKQGWDPEILAVVARRAMSEADAAQQRKDLGLMKTFNLKAKEAFETTLQLNPHDAVALGGLPRVDDALGNFEAAEAGHRRAMTLLWPRERSLRPHYYAARSSYLKALKAADDQKAFQYLREAEARFLERREILTGISVVAQEKELGRIIEAWIAFHEARILFKFGYDTWLNARPRNPELAYAMMLEARTRYLLSQKVVSKIDPRWQSEFEKLETQLGLLKSGQFRPAVLPDDEIQRIIAGEAGLDSVPATR